MSAPVWKGYIILANDTCCTILSESNNLTYVLPLIDGVKYPSGPTMVNSELMLDIFPSPIIGKKLITACKGYEYDLLRARRYHQNKRIRVLTPPVLTE